MKISTTRNKRNGTLINKPISQLFNNKLTKRNLRKFLSTALVDRNGLPLNILLVIYNSKNATRFYQNILLLVLI